MMIATSNEKYKYKRLLEKHLLEISLNKDEVPWSDCFRTNDVYLHTHIALALRHENDFNSSEKANRRDIARLEKVRREIIADLEKSTEGEVFQMFGVTYPTFRITIEYATKIFLPILRETLENYKPIVDDDKAARRVTSGSALQHFLDNTLAIEIRKLCELCGNSISELSTRFELTTMVIVAAKICEASLFMAGNCKGNLFIESGISIKHIIHKLALLQGMLTYNILEKAALRALSIKIAAGPGQRIKGRGSRIDITEFIEKTYE